MDKLNKIKEIKDLLESNTISNEEFEKLKAEILGVTAEKKELSDKDKIELISFKTDEDEIVSSPKINFLNFKNIEEEEKDLIKPFIRMKQIHAPDEMTKDEVFLLEKFFSPAEIIQINSERPGYNYYNSVFFCLALAVISFILYLNSPFLILLTTTFNVGLVIFSIVTLNKLDATKLDKRGSYLAIILVVIPIIMLIAKYD